MKSGKYSRDGLFGYGDNEVRVSCEWEGRGELEVWLVKFAWAIESCSWITQVNKNASQKRNGNVWQICVEYTSGLDLKTFTTACIIVIMSAEYYFVLSVSQWYIHVVYATSS